MVLLPAPSSFPMVVRLIPDLWMRRTCSAEREAQGLLPIRPWARARSRPALVRSKTRMASC
jgi:hypothetical protein